MRTPKRLIPFLLVPAVIGATIFAGVAAAQNSDTSGQSGATTTPAKPRPAGKIEDVLKKLVTDGVIAQAQADKIVEAFKVVTERPQSLPHLELSIRNITQSVATALGMDPAALIKELTDGKTLGEISVAHGSTVDKVVAALVAPVKERLDKLVADGKLTQAQADEQLAKFQANVKKHVESFKLPARPLANNGRGKGDRPAPGIGRGPALEQREKQIEKFRERLSEDGDDKDDDKPSLRRRAVAPPRGPSTPTPSTTSGRSL